MLQTDLITLLEELAPTKIAASWDNSGLQVASSRKEIHHLAICLDPSPKSVEASIHMGADFILSHHPLSMSPTYPNQLNTYHKVLSLLFSNDIPLFSAHTSLDSMPDARWLANDLGLTNLQAMEFTGLLEDGTEAGIGFVGEYAKPISYQDFIKNLKQYIPHTVPFQQIGQSPLHITRVAICPGSGASLTPIALQMDADIYITGDVKYHTALDFSQTVYHNAPLCIIDAGHFSIEEEMMRRFSQKLDALLNNVNITFISSHDPFSPITE